MKVETLHNIRTKEYLYQIVKSNCKTQGAEGRTVYGVKVILSSECECECSEANDCNCNDYSDSSEYAIVEDISCNINHVKQLVEKLVKGQVSPNQLIYIAQDFIADLP